MAKKHDCSNCEHEENEEKGGKKHKSKDVHGKILNMAKEK